MPIIVRPLRDDELRTYLEIRTSAVHGLAAAHYAPDVIDGWVVPITDATIHDLTLNEDGEVRLVAELDGTPVGIGALVLGSSELRAATWRRRRLDEVAARRWCTKSNAWRA
jgi:hypothetical protein